MTGLLLLAPLLDLFKYVVALGLSFFGPFFKLLTPLFGPAAPLWIALMWPVLSAIPLLLGFSAFVFSLMVPSFGGLLGIAGQFFSMFGPLFLIPMAQLLFFRAGPFEGPLLAALSPLLGPLGPVLLPLTPILQVLLPFLSIDGFALDRFLIILLPLLFPLLRFLAVLLNPLAPALVEVLGPAVLPLVPFLTAIVRFLIPLFGILASISMPVNGLLAPIFALLTGLLGPLLAPILSFVGMIFRGLTGLAPLLNPVLSLLRPILDLVFEVVF